MMKSLTYLKTLKEKSWGFYSPLIYNYQTRENIMDNGCKVLIGCETSGIVREAFNALGFDTWSCDVLPADTPTNRHIQDDVRNVIAMDNWDLVFIGHPPCTRLCNSGVRWLHKAPPGRTLDDMWSELDQGAELFSDLWNADVPCLAIENPVTVSYTHLTLPTKA